MKYTNVISGHLRISFKHFEKLLIKIYLFAFCCSFCDFRFGIQPYTWFTFVSLTLKKKTKLK